MGCKVPSNGFCTMATMNDAQPMHTTRNPCTEFMWTDSGWMKQMQPTRRQKITLSSTMDNPENDITGSRPGALF
jgi:hypothetical protein